MTATRSIGEVGSATLPASAWGDVAGSGRPGYRPRALLYPSGSRGSRVCTARSRAVTAGTNPGSRGRLCSRSPARDRHGTGTGPGGRDAIQGLPTNMQARLAESKGKRPGLLLRTENHPAGNEIGFRCLLGARAPPKPNPPSSRFRVAAPQSRLAPSRLAPSRLAPSRLAPSRLAPSGLAPSGLALSRLALRRLDATPPPGAGQIITGQLPSGRPARCWTACRNLPRIRAMSTREIVTLRIPERDVRHE